MRKKFKLNNKQDISIDDKHELYKDVLIKVLIDEDITQLLWSTLMKNGYRLGYQCWHHVTQSHATGNHLLILDNDI